MNTSTLIPYEDAVSIVTGQAWPADTERVALDAALGRVLAQEVRSDVDMPPFNKSAVDGYACRLADLAQPLRVLEVVPAGRMPAFPVGSGQCSKIMTGAPLPEGADCVVMVEHTEAAGEGQIRCTRETTGANYVPHGEELRIGDPVLTPGVSLRPDHIAVLAAMGVVAPRVARRPRIGVFATGDELVPPAQTPTGAKIRNSNSIQIESLLKEAGAEVTAYGIGPDDEVGLRACMEQALQENDIAVSTGGVSVGDFDFVPRLVETLGLSLHLRRVAIQPGKPVVFATGDGKAYFGLSGNPFSSYVQCLLFVIPFLRRMTGCTGRSLDIRLPLGETVRRRNADRMAWIPVAVRDAQAFPVRYHGSAHIHALAGADGIIAFPIGVDTLESGSHIAVRLIGHH
jgi:molybdopterin molybdotransferase